VQLLAFKQLILLRTEVQHRERPRRQKEFEERSPRYTDSNPEKDWPMTRNQLMFYATAQDLGPVLSSLEAEKRLQYTLAGSFKVNTAQTFSSYASIPELGRAHHPTAVANPTYLISPQGTPIRAREVPQTAGGVRYFFDQILNEDTVAFSPGGRYSADVILYGMIGTVSNSATSKSLYNFVAKPFREHFAKAREFLVGPEALSLAKGGVRLTIGASSPAEFDLRI
jgi:hypothetical protein